MTQNYVAYFTLEFSILIAKINSLSATKLTQLYKYFLHNEFLNTWTVTN